MKMTKKQWMIIGGVAIIGAIIYLSTRKKKTSIEITSSMVGEDFDI